VYLPRVDDAVDEPVTPPAPRSLRGSETILVIEDEEGVRELVRQVLERYGYRVLTAPAGAGSHSHRAGDHRLAALRCCTAGGERHCARGRN
jgi:hypothetical protein